MWSQLVLFADFCPQASSTFPSGLTLTVASFSFWAATTAVISLSVLWWQSSSCSHTLPKWERSLKISNWIVSSLHALVTTLVGLLIVCHTWSDLIFAKCDLTDQWAWALAGYFLLDTAILFHLEWIKNSNSKIGGKNASEAEEWRPTFNTFLRKALTWHHLLLLTVALPVILEFRKGRGDLFVGLLYTMEASVPFVAFKAYLRSSRQTRTRAYIINTCLLTLVYLVVRILVLPFVYVIHAHQQQKRLSEAALALPLHCHLGTLAIFAFQAFWFAQICHGAFKSLMAYFFQYHGKKTT